MGLFSFFRKKKANIDTPVTDISEEINIQSEIETISEETDQIINKEPDIVEPIEIIEDILETSNYEDLEDYDPTKDLSNYIFPSANLLKVYENSDINSEELEETKVKIISILHANNIDVLSIKANKGYVNTLYEITPKAGFRISKIKQLKTDLAFALLVSQLSIEPIMERGTIGIIVPNKDFIILPLSAIINSDTFQKSTFDLPLIIGRNMKTENFIVDLTKQPHLLIAGATGQGKSVLLNDFIVSLLYKKHPSELKLVLIDTHILEFNIYSHIEKHYLAKLPGSSKAVISAASSALATLNSLCIEMDNRYELLLKSTSRNIEEYNSRFKKRKLNPQHGHRFLPYIVAVIDEYFDLAIFTDKQIETSLIKLTRKAHVVGIHVILATQRPTKDIITGELKANFPVRIAFNVASSIESRIIIDKIGAEDLSGKGDCLYCEGINTVRIQVPYIDTEELEGITLFIGNQQGYTTAYELPIYIDSSYFNIGNIDLNDRDPLFEEAARLIVIHQQGSTSLIQRKFSIGYNRAGRLMEQLEAAGIVGATQGSKPRDVLIANEYILEQKLGSL